MLRPSRKNGNGGMNLLDILEIDQGRILPIDLKRNELIVLKSGGKVVEFLGIPKGGKSKHIELLCQNLSHDEELTEILGNRIDIVVFKPNTLLKLLYEKDPATRAIYNSAIIHLHGVTLDLLNLQRKGAVPVNKREIDLALIDRGPIDDMVWTQTLRSYKNYLSSENMRNQIAMARDLERYIDLAIGINVPAEVAKGREGPREGNVMTISFLRALYEYFSELSRESQEYGQPLHIDTSYMDINGLANLQENAQMVYQKVKSLYLRKDIEELRPSNLEAIAA